MACLFAALLPAGLAAARTAESQGAAVRPARVAQIKNFDLEAARSNRPAYVPREWGKLVSVERLDEQHFALFFQPDTGELILVRMVQRGGYLYLDTRDEGGVATVLRREP
jgi:hypothetical protein